MHRGPAILISLRNQLQFQQRLCRPNWTVEMAIYSLTGNGRSPFHAEPPHNPFRGPVALLARFSLEVPQMKVYKRCWTFVTLH
jgi:hypothetical protein